MLRRLTEAERKAKEEEFLDLARTQFRRMFDPERQPGLRTFKEREDCACEGGDALSQALMELHLREDELARPVAVYACGKCGRPTLEKEGDGEPPERSVVARRGAVSFARPERTCGVCRRALFPPRR